MTEATIIAIANLFYVVLCLWLVRTARQDALEREKALLKMITSLQNRITAKDLQGFTFLETNEKEAAKPHEDEGFGPRDDASEAVLEQLRRNVQ